MTDKETSPGIEVNESPALEPVILEADPIAAPDEPAFEASKVKKGRLVSHTPLEQDGSKPVMPHSTSRIDQARLKALRRMKAKGTLSERARIVLDQMEINNELKEEQQKDRSRPGQRRQRTVVCFPGTNVPIIDVEVGEGMRCAILGLLHGQYVVKNMKYKIQRQRSDGTLVLKPDGVVKDIR